MRLFDKFTYLLLFVTMMLAGCRQDMFYVEDDIIDAAVLTDVSFSLTQKAMTRSTISEGMVDNISTARIGVYDNAGRLYGDLELTSGSTGQMKLKAGMDYTVYALVNIHSMEDFPSSESVLISQIFPVSMSDMGSYGVPMCGKVSLSAEDVAMGVANILVERLVTRIGFSVDRSLLNTSELTITSVSLCQAAGYVSPFAGPYKAGTVSTGDSATATDLAMLNAGGSIWFYALENVQGILLPGNTDPWKKEPLSVGSKNDVCTYLEVTASHKGSYQGVPVSSDNVKYRFYLGKDNVSDFSLERNKGIVVSLVVSDKGMYDDKWKIEYGEDLPLVEYELKVEPSSVSVDVAGMSTVKAMYYQIVNGARNGGTDVSSSASWSSSSTAIAKVDAGRITGVKKGSAVVTAAYSGKSGSADVTVNDVVTHRLVITPSSYTMSAGSSLDFSAFYYTTTNGVEDSGEDVTASASWASSSAAVASVSKGKVSAIKGGSSIISVTYNGYSAQADVTVTDVVSKRLVVTPAVSTINAKSTVALKAMLYTTTNGVEDAGSDVTSSAVWKTSSTAVANVSAGMVTGVSQGEATITASYSGYTGSATVNVNDVISHRLVITPVAASVNAKSTVSLKAMYYTTTNGVEDAGTDVTALAAWSSGSSSIATVSKGVVTGIKGGLAEISATYAGSSAVASVTVNDVITNRLAITPETATVNAKSTVSLKATYYTSTNGIEDGGIDVTTMAAWSSSSTDVATVNSGVVTGVKGGTSNITVHYGGCSATSSITVKDVITHRLVVTPSSVSVNVGSSTYLIAVYYTTINGVEDSGTDITGSATWSSDNTAVATVSGGTVSGIASGSAVIKAVFNGSSETAVVTVKDVVTYKLEVTPSETTVKVGSTVSLKAMVYKLTNGVSDSGTDVTDIAVWSSGNTATATVNKGVVTGVYGGTVGVTAFYNMMSATASIKVTNVVSYRIEITPDPVSLSAGSTLQLTAIVYTTTNGVEDSGYDRTNSLNWSSTNTDVATVGKRDGLVTGVSTGSANIIVSGAGPEVMVQVSVTDNVVYKYSSIMIDPDEVEMAVNTSYTPVLKAVRDTYVNGVKKNSVVVSLNNNQATWSLSSGETSKFSINTTTGKVTANGIGYVIVKAIHKSDSSLTATLRIESNEGSGTDTGWDDDGNIEL